MSRGLSRMALAVGVLLGGCYRHTHLRHNAPGDIEVERPPDRIEERAVEKPLDPGEHRLLFTFGALAGFGLHVPNHDETEWGPYIAPELSLHYGRAASHGDDSWYAAVPRTRYGLNLGYQLIDAVGPVQLDALHAFYLEAQASYVIGSVAAGIQSDFERERHGPQLTLALGPLYLRGAYLAGLGSQVHLGLVIKGGHLWVWSR